MSMFLAASEAYRRLEGRQEPDEGKSYYADDGNGDTRYFALCNAEGTPLLVLYEDESEGKVDVALYPQDWPLEVLSGLPEGWEPDYAHF